MVSPQRFSALRSSSASFLAPPAAGPPPPDVQPAAAALRCALLGAARCAPGAASGARERRLRPWRWAARLLPARTMIYNYPNLPNLPNLPRTKMPPYASLSPQHLHPRPHLAAVCGAPAFAPLAGHPRQPLLAQGRPRPGAAGRAQQATAQVEQGVHGGNCRGLHAALTAGFMVDISNYSEWMWIWVMKQFITGLCLARGVCMVLEA